jgi:hypothetical protein
VRDLDPHDPDVWTTVRSVVARARSSSLHCSIASIGPDGTPHVTPIGSLMLGAPGHASYLDVFNVQLGRNLDRDPQLAILAVDSGKVSWARSLLRGQFREAPGVRLLGTAGPSRPATDAELARFQRWVRVTLRTRGGRAMWGRTDGLRARDVTIERVVPVRIPRMTVDLWSAAPGTDRKGEDQPLTSP